jgi:two-component system chemotaxis response regulator CheY
MPRILVVDDSPTMRHHISSILQKAGFEVRSAVDGMAGLELLQSAEPLDLALLDVHMPRMGGLELVATLREEGCRPELPIVVLSAEAGEASVTRARALGVRHWFVKPFAPEALVEAIRNAIGAGATG